MFDTAFGTEPTPNYNFRSTSVHVALPVELTRFAAASEKHTVRLSWETASEKDHGHYLVERSTDGSSFYPVGTIKGSGNSTQAMAYSFVDENPLSGYSYYRLQMVDVHGNFRPSPVIAVSRQNIAQRQLLTYPNPTEGELTLQIQTIAAEELEITVMDVTGRVLQRENYSATSGNNSIVLNLDKVRSGSCILQVKGATWSLQQRVVKY